VTDLGASAPPSEHGKAAPERAAFFVAQPAPPLRHNLRMKSPLDSRFILCVLALAAGAASAQDAKPVYRCPGPPVLYTDAMSAQEAKDKGCKTIEGAPITIVQAVKPRLASPAAASAPRSGDTKVDPASQRARDSDARRILADELRAEEERLAAMKADFNNGEPERKGDERNFAKYQERVNEMRAAIQRKEADVLALRREMAKLSQ
jgi:hypothetical protein